jgi:hypothetical protein
VRYFSGSGIGYRVFISFIFLYFFFPGKSVYFGLESELRWKGVRIRQQRGLDCLVRPDCIGRLGLTSMQYFFGIACV